MNIFDLDKLATPRPLRVLTEYGNRVAGKDGHLMCICECSSVDEPDRIKREADAKLVAHCRNNYLKALGALKAEHAITVSFEADRASSTPHCPEICHVCELIKELETVQ
jgi:hypothetical protein